MSLYSGLGAAGPSAHTDLLSAKLPDNPSSQRALIEEIKRRGRACVISKNYPDADSLYGKGIEILESMIVGAEVNDEKEDDASSISDNKKDVAIFYSNRSLVRMQMGKITEALEDADMAVSHDATYVKAHWRRGQASNACGNTSQALVSFEKALELDPTNKALKKEVASAIEKKVQEEKLLKEAEEAAAVAAENGDGGGSAENDVVMKDAQPPPSKTTNATTTTTKKDEKKSTKSSSQNSVKETDDSLFTKSDHVRGYKIRSDGKKTSYFHREISDDAKKLIGDIAPKKLDSGGSGNNDDFAPKPIGGGAAGEGGGTSAWNKAGTWEERDVTPWAKETLTAQLLTAEYILPPGSPSPGAHATVTKVSKLDGHASYATVRGKKRYIYEFGLTIKWILTLGDDHTKTCHGEMTFPDVDGTVELGEAITMTASLFVSVCLIIAAASRGEAFSGTSSPARNQLQRIDAHHQQPTELISAHYTTKSCTPSPSCVLPMPSRRAVVAAAASALLVVTGVPPSALSAPVPDEKLYVRGVSTLQSGVSIETIGPDAALYVTARPNRPDNVPRAILDGSRGKPPPVLSARFANPTFPFDFTLTSQNFTPEGASMIEGGDNNDVWWSGEDLIVSARLDSDGVAATRDPTDLVGRGVYSASSNSDVSVELQGRGLFGKSVTAKK